MIDIVIYITLPTLPTSAIASSQPKKWERKQDKPESRCRPFPGCPWQPGPYRRSAPPAAGKASRETGNLIFLTSW